MAGIDNVTTDDKQKLFVIKTESGYSCRGYENVFKESLHVATLLERPDLAPKQAEFGKVPQYANYLELVSLHAKSPVSKRTYFSGGTPEGVKDTLEAARRDGKRVRITYGDTGTGRPWDDKPESGTVGRSGGSMKAPLLVKTTRSHGGGAIMTDVILRIEDAKTKALLYLHPACSPVPPSTPDPTSEPEEAPSLGM